MGAGVASTAFLFGCKAEEKRVVSVPQPTKTPEPTKPAEAPKPVEATKPDPAAAPG